MAAARFMGRGHPKTFLRIGTFCRLQTPILLGEKCCRSTQGSLKILLSAYFQLQVSFILTKLFSTLKGILMNVRKFVSTLVTVSSLLVAQSAMAQAQVAPVVGGSAAGVAAGTTVAAAGGVVLTATVVAGSLVWVAVDSNKGTAGTVRNQ
jgi:hypothetical protein